MEAQDKVAHKVKNDEHIMKSLCISHILKFCLFLFPIINERVFVVNALINHSPSTHNLISYRQSTDIHIIL